jgi:predicted nucleic acid-binding protein
MSAILADTGALVALLDRREQYHAWAVTQARTLHPPLLLCEPVLAELCFLLAGTPGGISAVHACLASGAWRVDFSIAPEWERVFALMDAYSDQPMSLADACVVRMAELHKEAKVFTLDGHFRVYRRNRRQLIPLIVPSDIQ